MFNLKCQKSIHVINLKRTQDFARKCSTYHWKVPNEEDLIPITLYHVSIDRDSVCKEGLKTRKELRKEGKMSLEGVGGGSDDLISFTYDRDLAIDYLNDMITLSKIANGIVDIDDIDAYLDEHDALPRPRMNPSMIFRKSDDEIIPMWGYHVYPGILDDLKEGFVMHDTEQGKNKKMDLSEDEKKRILFDIVSKLYFWNRSHLGGRQNPVLSSNFKNYQGKIHPDKIGLFKVAGFIPKSIEVCKKIDEVWKYGQPVEYPETSDVMRLFPAELEIRIHPKYTRNLEEIDF